MLQSFVGQVIDIIPKTEQFKQEQQRIPNFASALKKDLKKTKSTKVKIVEFVKKGKTGEADLVREAEELERKLKEIQKQLDDNNSKKASINNDLVKGRVELAKANNKTGQLREGLERQ